MLKGECPVFIFDFDGVLYSGGMIRSVGVEALLEAVSIGGVIYIVSGRRRWDKRVIINVLKGLRVPQSSIHGIIVRSRGGEVDHKLEAYRIIMYNEDCIGEIHDDNPEALRPARRLVERGLVLHYSNYCVAIHGYTILSACKPIDPPEDSEGSTP